MGTPSRDDVQDWIGLVVRDAAGTELGRVERLYADEDSGEPEWLLLHAPGTRNSYFVPVRDAQRDGEAVKVAWPDSIVFTSPTLDATATLTDEDEARLYRHYDTGSPARTGTGPVATARARLRKLAEAAPAVPGVTRDTGTPSPAGTTPTATDARAPAAAVAALALLALLLVRRLRRRSR